MQYKNMSEHKRVPFTTVAPTKKEKKRENKAKCLRISLTLPESNEKSCPEFNYRELVAHNLSKRFQKKQVGKSGSKPLGNVINTPMLDATDPFARDEDESLRLLAENLERKYGGYASAKKKKRKKENDFTTLGEGYDAEDPFIDDSDAIDEVLAINVDTKHRGFYINSGALELDEVEASDGDGESDSEDEIVKKKKKSNRIDSESEDDDNGSEDEDGSKKRKFSSENGVDKPKKRKLDEGEMLRKRKKMIDKMNAKKVEHLEKKDSDGEKVANGSDSKASDKSIAASIESVINKAREGDLKNVEENSNTSTGTTSSSSDSDSSNSSSSKDSDSEDENEDGEREGDGEDSQERSNNVENGHLNPDNGHDMPLPENLPQDLLLVIAKLKHEGKICTTTSQKFFTDTVNKILINIEIKLIKIGGRKKTQIYNHLAQHTPCGAQTLIKRAKNLLAERNDNKLKEPLKKLQEAVEKCMPAMLEMYKQECLKAAEINIENGLVEKDIDSIQDSEKKKSARLPKRKFIFTDEVRLLLCNVVQVRVSAWQIMKKRSESPEEHIKSFLDSEVRPLWPKGWMNARILLKESINAHACITDKAFIKANSVKKLSVLGVSSSPVNVPQREFNSTKPSLTATVKPSLPSSPQQSTGTTTFKPIINSSQTTTKSSLSVAPKPHKVQLLAAINAAPKSDNIPKKVGISNENSEKISISGLNIRSVENINVSSKPNSQINIMPINVTEKVHCNLITNKRLSSDIIDLSSDEERTQNKSKSTSVITNVTNDPAINTAKALSRNNDNKVPLKDDNLDEEMNSVMNEILNISRNYSPDRSSASSTKESSPSTIIVNTSMSSNQNQSQLSTLQSQSQVINKPKQISVSSSNQQLLKHQISPLPKPASSSNQQSLQHQISPMPKSVSTNQQSLNQISPIAKQGSISVASWSKMESNTISKTTGTSSSNISWATSTPVQNLSGNRSKQAETLPIGKSTSSSNSNINSSSSGMLGNNRASISIVKSTSGTSSLNYNSTPPPQPTNPAYASDTSVNRHLKQKVTSQNVSSVYSGLTQEQLQQYKQLQQYQKQQQQQKQQELLQQNLLSNIPQMSEGDMYKLMTQMGYQQSQTGTGQKPGKF